MPGHREPDGDPRPRTRCPSPAAADEAAPRQASWCPSALPDTSPSHSTPDVTIPRQVPLAGSLSRRTSRIAPASRLARTPDGDELGDPQHHGRGRRRRWPARIGSAGRGLWSRGRRHTHDGKAETLRAHRIAEVRQAPSPPNLPGLIQPVRWLSTEPWEWHCPHTCWRHMRASHQSSLDDRSGRIYHGPDGCGDCPGVLTGQFIGIGVSCPNLEALNDCAP